MRYILRKFIAVLLAYLLTLLASTLIICTLAAFSLCSILVLKFAVFAAVVPAVAWAHFEKVIINKNKIKSDELQRTEEENS